MVGTTVSHYTILSKLGQGGMGVIHKRDSSAGATISPAIQTIVGVTPEGIEVIRRRTSNMNAPAGIRSVLDTRSGVWRTCDLDQGSVGPPTASQNYTSPHTRGDFSRSHDLTFCSTAINLARNLSHSP